MMPGLLRTGHQATWRSIGLLRILRVKPSEGTIGGSGFLRGFSPRHN